MFKTRVTELLGIQHPIIQGGMLWLSTAELVAAVSDAGGLGILTAASYSFKEDLKREIRRVRELTDKPFGVNITLLPTARPVRIEDMVESVIEEKVPVVETSGRSPEPYIRALKEGGIKVMHKAGAVRHARTAERIGCDAVIALGFEAAGHPMMDDVTSLVLLPRVVEEVKIPVIAAGGFGDARGFLAALALGAEGILMGTRFVATRECIAHPRFKEALVRAKETETVLIQRSLQNQARVLRNKLAEKVLEMESQGASLEELLPYISGERGRKAWLEGNLEDGSMACGQVVGLVREVVSAKELLQSIIEGAEAILREINGKVASL